MEHRAQHWKWKRKAKFLPWGAYNLHQTHSGLLHLQDNGSPWALASCWCTCIQVGFQPGKKPVPKSESSSPPSHCEPCLAPQKKGKQERHWVRSSRRSLLQLSASLKKKVTSSSNKDNSSRAHWNVTSKFALVLFLRTLRNSLLPPHPTLFSVKCLFFFKHHEILQREKQVKHLHMWVYRRRWGPCLGVWEGEEAGGWHVGWFA